MGACGQGLQVSDLSRQSVRVREEQRHSGADPGFPLGGGTDPSGVNIRFCQIKKKLHEIEKKLGRGGARGAPRSVNYIYDQ